MNKKIKANTQKCVNCGKQADLFFGLADPDGISVPLCNKCCEESKKRIFDECLKVD